MITKDFSELCLSPRIEEPKSEVNKPFVPELQSLPIVFCICNITVVIEMFMATSSMQHNVNDFVV